MTLLIGMATLAALASIVVGAASILSSRISRGERPLREDGRAELAPAYARRYA